MDGLIRKLEDVRVCMQQVSCMTNELRSADDYICMCKYKHTYSKGNLFEKQLHTDDAVCGATGIDKKISRTCEAKDQEYLLSQSQLFLPTARPRHELIKGPLSDNITQIHTYFRSGMRYGYVRSLRKIVIMDFTNSASTS